MDILDAVIVFAAGAAAGFFNTVAGGGSLISLPLLIFLGLPPAVANATNRVAIFSQNVFAVAGFKSRGVSTFGYGLLLGTSALIGAIAGARIAVEISGALFNRILALVMVAVVVSIVFKRSNNTQAATEKMGRGRQMIAFVVFFFIGIYGGFIQAGVGFLIIGALTAINGFSLVKINSIKVLVVLVYTISALIVFIIEGQINWLYGIVLAAGNSAGAWFTSRWSVAKGDALVKKILLIAVIALAIRLWFF